MFRRILAILWLLICLFGAACAEQGAQSLISPVACREDRPGCQVLQMVMMGSFDALDPNQLLSVRVLSAAYPKLKAITTEDIRHYTGEFGAEEALLRKEYYIALGNCLWADILMGEAGDPQEEEARQVLLLFLDPASASNAEQQMELIRAAVNDRVYEQLARRTGLEMDFIRYLIESENWRESETAD